MRRTSLREYQEDLAARLRSAESAQSAPSRLGMQAGDRFWLLDLADVGEVVPVPDLLAVPLTRPWVSGVVSVRGNLHVVVDFAAFCDGGTAGVPGERARLLLIGERHRINSGLVFTRAVGLRPSDGFEPVPEPGSGARSWEGARYRDRDGRTWTSLDVGSLVADPAFLQIEL